MAAWFALVAVDTSNLDTMSDLCIVCQVMLPNVQDNGTQIYKIVIVLPFPAVFVTSLSCSLHSLHVGWI